MADHLAPDKRSWNMAQIKSKDTSCELKVRKYLFSKGFRYRKNVANLPGKPDIVLPRYHTAVFIHGCFWHRHDGCKRASMPKSKQDYWQKKFTRNINNDILHKEQLEATGWNVIIVWECQINNSFEKTMHQLIKQIKSHSSSNKNE